MTDQTLPPCKLCKTHLVVEDANGQALMHPYNGPDTCFLYQFRVSPSQFDQWRALMSQPTPQSEPLDLEPIKVFDATFNAMSDAYIAAGGNKPLAGPLIAAADALIERLRSHSSAERIAGRREVLDAIRNPSVEMMAAVSNAASNLAGPAPDRVARDICGAIAAALDPTKEV